MPKRRRFKQRLHNLIVVRAGAKQLSMIALDLPDEAEAFVVAKHLAASTGRAVTIRDAFGEILETVQAPALN